MGKNLTSASEVILTVVTRNGEFLVGFGRNFRWNERVTLSEERVLGQWYAAEIVNHGFAYSWSMDQLTVFAKTLKEQGIIPTEDRMPFGDGFIIRVVNRFTNEDLCIIIDAHAENTDTTANSQTTIATSLSGLAIRAYDRAKL